MKDLNELFEFIKDKSHNEIMVLIDKHVKELIKEWGTSADGPFKSQLRDIDNLNELLKDYYNKKLPSRILEKVNNKGKLLTVTEVSEMLNVTVPTIYSYVKRGLLECVNLGDKSGRQLKRFNSDEIDEFIRNNK